MKTCVLTVKKFHLFLLASKKRFSENFSTLLQFISPKVFENLSFQPFWFFLERFKYLILKTTSQTSVQLMKAQNKENPCCKKILPMLNDIFRMKAEA